MGFHVRLFLTVGAVDVPLPADHVSEPELDVLDPASVPDPRPATIGSTRDWVMVIGTPYRFTDTDGGFLDFLVWFSTHLYLSHSSTS